MKLRVLFLAVLSSCSFGQSPETPPQITQFKGYTNAKVLKVEPDGIKILHDRGISKLSLDELTHEQRAHYKLDEQTAKEYRKLTEVKKQNAIEQARIDEELNHRKVRVRAIVKQVVPSEGGVLLKSVEIYGGKKEVKDLEYTGKQPLGMGKTSMNPKADFVAEVTAKYRWVDSWQRYADLVFVSCPTDSRGEFTSFEEDVWIIGNFTYLSKGGENITVALFTTDKTVAERKLLP